MRSIDVNSDLGETTAGTPVSDDAAIMELVSSANVACGFHAGDPHSISATLSAAVQRGVSVGAHVGYRDAAGFGRRFIDYAPGDLADEVLYQIGALDALARARGTSVGYVKPHGALYNAIVHHEAQAQAVIDGIKAFSTELPVMLLPGAVAIDKAEQAGLRVVREAFADRQYNPDGTLVSRSEPDAMLTDPEAVSRHVLQIAETGSLTARDGSTVDVDAQSICIHGDSPGSVEIARRTVAALTEAGVGIRSFL